MRRVVVEDEVFQSIRFQVGQLSAVVAENEKRKQQQWKEDSEVLKAYVSALSATRSVLKEEQNAVLVRLNKMDPKKGTSASKEGPPETVLTKSEVQERLSDFRQRVKEAETRVEQAVVNLSVAQKKEERCMLEEQITIMSETRQLCLEEAQLLEVMLKEIEAAEQSQKEKAQIWEQLTRLKDQLAKVEAKVDQAKRCLLFPAVHGYRFRIGNGGIYVGAKDLYVSDLNAGFSLSVERVDSTERKAAIRIRMGGRETRPAPLVHSLGTDDSGDYGADLRSMDANDINNAPVSPPVSVDAASTTVEEREDGTSPEGPDAASEPGDSIPEAAPPGTRHRETAEEQISVDEGSERESVPDAVDQSLQPRPSRGKSMAMKFLTKIADKSHIPRGVARASQALFFTQPPKMKFHRTPTPPTNTLFKEFALAQDIQAPVLNSKSGGDRTALQYAKPPLLPPMQPKPEAEESKEKSQILTESPQSADDPKPSIPLPPEGTGLEGVSLEGGLESLAPSRWRKTFSLDKVESSGVSFSWRDTRSEVQSDVTSLVGAGRRGVHVKLQGSHVSVVGEKGTRVPNITVRELTLEVECCLSVVLEFSEKTGWHSPQGLKFEVIQLKKKTLGNSIPLPAGLVKTILNLILPRVVERALISAVPVELGTYVLESEKGMTAAGEVIVMGPPLSTTQAPLNTPSPYGRPRPRATELRAYPAVQEAQSLLSLTQDQAVLLGMCFSKDKWGLLGEGWTGMCSIHELCRFYDCYAKSEIWLALCDLWNKALQYVSQQQDFSCRLDFGALMNETVARLAAKPVRLQCLFTQLNCQLNVDALLLCMRDYCERSAKEVHAEKPLSVAIPLEEQLQALNAWYADVKAWLLAFKSHFKSFMSAIVARADAKSLQIGLEKACYEGPLHFELPLQREADASGKLSFDIAIPAPGSSNSTDFMESLYRAMRTIHAFKRANSQPTASSHEAEDGRRLEWGISSATDAKLEAVLKGKEDASEFHEAVSVGRAFLQRLQTSIALNTESLAQKLHNRGESLEDFKTRLERLGDVVAGTLVPDPTTGHYTLTFQSNDYARIKCLIEALGFQSTVSPAEVLSMMHICVREYLRTFYKRNVAKQRATERLFRQIIRYVDKRSLDGIVCSKLESEVHHGHLIVSLSELHDAENAIRFPIQITNDFDIISLMDSLTLAQGKLEFDSLPKGQKALRLFLRDDEAGRHDFRCDTLRDAYLFYNRRKPRYSLDARRLHVPTVGLTRRALGGHYIAQYFALCALRFVTSGSRLALVGTCTPRRLTSNKLKNNFQKVTSVVMEHLTTVYEIATASKPEANVLPRHCGGEALEGCKRYAGSCDDIAEEGQCCGIDGLDVVSVEKRFCSLVVPPAITMEQSTTIDVQFLGDISATDARLLVHQHSEILFEKFLTKQNIIDGKIEIELPALYEGTVTFLLLMEDGVVSVPCCVMPRAVAGDVKGLLATMMGIARNSPSLVEELGDEQALMHYVWTDSFMSFLTEVDLLFECLRDCQNSGSAMMDVFVNVLRQSCLYEAWEFGAYMLNKASECGVNILSSSAAQDQPFTAQTLRATICCRDQTPVHMRDDASDCLVPEGKGSPPRLDRT